MGMWLDIYKAWEGPCCEYASSILSKSSPNMGGECQKIYMKRAVIWEQSYFFMYSLLQVSWGIIIIKREQ